MNKDVVVKKETTHSFRQVFCAIYSARGLLPFPRFFGCIPFCIAHKNTMALLGKGHGGRS